MSPREPVSDHGRLFGGNTMYEVLLAIALRRGDPFHGAAIARQIGRTDAQALAEIAKLGRVGAIEEAGRQGRRKRWVARRTPLSTRLFELPSLLQDELGVYPRLDRLEDDSAHP